MNYVFCCENLQQLGYFDFVTPEKKKTLLDDWQ